MIKGKDEKYCHYTPSLNTTFLTTLLLHLYNPPPAHILSPALTSLTTLSLLTTLGGGVIIGVESTCPAPGNCVNTMPSAGGAKGSGTGAVSPVGSPAGTLTIVAVPFTIIVATVLGRGGREQ
ncbi:hypothetical protein FKW77_003726 [Venturia effusa]|uniref:Uncharacterized protein n=1 Tax=Venturia effusa TaxID=50376 RepID=A0A517L906_9PEZI|nr:hypothetical protein FKW77_003726 [Venturia effusa]